MKNFFFLALFVFGCNSNVNLQQTQKEVLDFVDAFGETWAVQEDSEELRNFFAKDFYTISPSDSFRLEGRENNIAAYKAFLQSTDILEYDFYDENVQVFNNGKSAVVSLYYKMLMKIGQDTVHSAGRDMLVLIKEKDKWEIVADHFSNFPKK